MKVHELIAKLQQLPPNHDVVVDLHSDFGLAAEPQVIEAYDNGGYVSYAFRPEDRLRTRGYVYIGAA